jgi:hypothetical protein
MYTAIPCHLAIEGFRNASFYILSSILLESTKETRMPDAGKVTVSFMEKKISSLETFDL